MKDIQAAVGSYSLPAEAIVARRRELALRDTTRWGDIVGERAHQRSAWGRTNYRRTGSCCPTVFPSRQRRPRPVRGGWHLGATLASWPRTSSAYAGHPHIQLPETGTVTAPILILTHVSMCDEGERPCDRRHSGAPHHARPEVEHCGLLGRQTCAQRSGVIGATLESLLSDAPCR